MPLSEAQAIALYESRFWESMPVRDRAMFQMFEPRLCMPFCIFQMAVEETLGRSVFTHEFALGYADGLRQELLAGKKAPTPQELINLIPADKRAVITVEGGK